MQFLHPFDQIAFLACSYVNGCFFCLWCLIACVCEFDKLLTLSTKDWTKHIHKCMCRHKNTHTKRKKIKHRHQILRKLEYSKMYGKMIIKLLCTKHAVVYMSFQTEKKKKMRTRNENEKRNAKNGIVKVLFWDEIVLVVIYYVHINMYINSYRNEGAIERVSLKMKTSVVDPAVEHRSVLCLGECWTALCGLNTILSVQQQQNWLCNFT